MREQVGWRGLVRTLRHEAPFWAATLPQLPRLVHRTLAEDRLRSLQAVLEVVAVQNARRNRLLGLLVAAAVLGLALAVWNLLL
jgi:ubiquinone biosynthesis protein